MGEDGGAGRRGMKPIPSTKQVGRQDNDDDKKIYNNQPMMVAVRGWGRMRWAIEGWASEAR